MRRIGLGLLLLAMSLTVWAGQSLTVLPLHHRLPEQVIPTLQPLLEPGATLVGANNQLVIRTSKANLDEIRTVLATLDTPMRRLTIAVRQQQYRGTRGHKVAVDAAVISPGNAASVTVEANASTDTVHEVVTQQVQSVEGEPTLIYLGRSFPIAMQSLSPDDGHAPSVAFVDVGSGFSARVQIVGARVHLDIQPTMARVDGGQIRQATLSTTVEGVLGNWIALGSGTLDSTALQAVTAGQGRHFEQIDQQVWLRVALVDDGH